MNATLIKDPSKTPAENSGIYILVFKTNISYKKDFKVIELCLAELGHVSAWHVDREDTDKVLRVESAKNDPITIIKTITQAGFFCEELNN